MYDRIIVPIEEGGQGAAESLDQACPLARALGCELTLLHVHLPREAPEGLEGLPQYRFQGVVERWDARDQEVEAEEAAWLASMAEVVAFRESDLKVSSRVVHAPLARSLREGDERVLVVAPAEDVQLDGLNRTVAALARGGGVPILVCRPDVPLLPIRRMVVTLDGSSFSEEVLAPAVEFARATGARLSLLQVVTRRGLRGLLRPGEQSAESAEQFLRDVRSRIPEELGPVDVRVVEEGNAAAGIVREARREEVDLVAMATHGRGGLRRVILGSVAESVIRAAEVPVLLYRPMGVEAGSAAPERVEAAAQ